MSGWPGSTSCALTTVVLGSGAGGRSGSRSNRSAMNANTIRNNATARKASWSHAPVFGDHRGLYYMNGVSITSAGTAPGPPSDRHPRVLHKGLPPRWGDGSRVTETGSRRRSRGPTSRRPSLVGRITVLPGAGQSCLWTSRVTCAPESLSTSLYFRKGQAQHAVVFNGCSIDLQSQTPRNPPAEPVGGEFVGIRHRSIFGSREPGVPREVVAMA